MEAGYGFTADKTSSRPGWKLVHWQNDWNKFKRLFKAAGQLNGIADAVRYGEYLANDANIENVKAEYDECTETLKRKALEQSPKLAALLTLAIADSAGAQQSIVMDEFDNEEDGMTAWQVVEDRRRNSV